MVGWRYDGPFDDLPIAREIEHRVIPWGDVGEEEGAGIVHIAPGCGEEDNLLGKEHGLPTIAPLDEYGIYLDGFGWLTGMDVHDVEKPILDDLEEKEPLLPFRAIRAPLPALLAVQGEARIPGGVRMVHLLAMRSGR